MLASEAHEYLFASSWEHDVLLIILAAPNDPAFPVDRLVHRLRSVELRVAERG